MRLLLILFLLAFVAGMFFHGPSNAQWLPVMGMPFVVIGSVLVWSRKKSLGLARVGRTTPIGALLVGFLVWGIATILWSGWPFLSYWYWITFGWLVVSYALASRLPGEQVCRLLYGALGVVVLTAIMAVVDYAWFSPRASGPFIDPNSFAALLNVAMFAALGEYVRKSWHGPRSKLLFGAVTILAVTLVLTQSRGAWIAFLGGAFLYLVITWRFRGVLPRPALWKGPAAVLVGLVLGAASLGVSFLDRAESVVTSDQTARLLIWDSTLEAINEHGVWGTGLGTFKLYYPEFRHLDETGTTGDMAHNDYLQLALETGVPGALMFTLVPVLVFWIFLRGGVFVGARDVLGGKNRRFSALVFLIGVLTAFAHALVNFVFYETAITMIVGLALAIGLRRLGTEEAGDVPGASMEIWKPSQGLLPWGLAAMLSLGMLLDAYIGTFLALDSPHVEEPTGVGADRYGVAQLVSTLYPVNTKATEYAMAAEFNEAAGMPIPPIKEMAEKLATDNANRLLRYKNRDCMAQTISAEFPTRVAQREGVTDADTYAEAISKLQVVNRQLPLCMPAYLELSDLLVLTGEKSDALAVLLGATKVFAIRDEDQTNRLEVLERAGRLAQELGEVRLAHRMAASLIQNDPSNDWAREFLNGG